MQMIVYREDRVWENVLEALSVGGRLSRYQRMPRQELSAILRIHGRPSVKNLHKLYSLVQSGSDSETQSYIESLSEPRLVAMLYSLIHCMRCWIETDSPVSNVRRKWRIANS